MRRGVRALAGLALVLAVASVLAGCAPRGDEGAGATVEREEIRAGRRVLLQSHVAPRRVTLGDPVVWTLMAELPANARPGKLLRSRAPAELDVQAPATPRSDRARTATGKSAPDRKRWTWDYRLRGFGLGPIALPAMRLPVAYGTARDTLLFPADTLAVDSLTREATGTVLPDRGPITPELRPVDYVVAGALALLAIAAILLLVRALRRRKRGGEAVAAPPDPPDVILQRAIQALRAEGEPLPRDAFYDRLSLAIRDYAAAVTEITTRDRTTLEIVRDLRARTDIPSDAVDALRRALARADLAKFARRGGGWDEALEALGLAEQLPARLPPRPPAVPETPAAGASASAASAASPPKSGAAGG